MIGDEKARNRELVRKMQARDKIALNEFHGLYKRDLYGYIAKRVDDWRDAQELVQDTFCKVWDNIHSLTAPEKVRSWMYSIADQLLIGWHRKHKQSKAAGSTTDVYEGEGEFAASAIAYQIAEEAAIEAEQFAAFDKALAQLPEREQQMVHLQLDGKSYKEIAEICNVSVSTVRNALPRAKRKLKAWAENWKEANAES